MHVDAKWYWMDERDDDDFWMDRSWMIVLDTFERPSGNQMSERKSDIWMMKSERGIKSIHSIINS